MMCGLVESYALGLGGWPKKVELEAPHQYRE